MSFRKHSLCVERVNYMMIVYIISAVQRIVNDDTKVLLFSKVLIHYKD